jgi:hypothetical protein
MSQMKCDNCGGFVGDMMDGAIPVDGKGLCKYCAQKAIEAKGAALAEMLRDVLLGKTIEAVDYSGEPAAHIIFTFTDGGSFSFNSRDLAWWK